jgi:hypothetical protein
MRQRLIQGRWRRGAIAFLISMPVLDTWWLVYRSNPTILLCGSAAIIAALALWALA